MAETMLSAYKYDVMQESLETRPQVAIRSLSPSATAVSFPSDSIKTTWDISLDEITATVLAELRF